MGQSKASNENDYVDLQIRTDGTDTFKVQGAGTPANRPYGVADVVTVNPGFGIGGYVKGLEATATSLAGEGSKAAYVPVQAAIRGSQIHFQIVGATPFSVDNPNELSRDYGAIFNIPINEAPALAEFVHTNGSGGSGGLGGGDIFGTDDDSDNNDDVWDGKSTYSPNEKTDKCECGSCESTNSDGTPKTVVIDGVTYNITPTE